MADDVTVDNGTGTDYVVATDDDGSGNQVQIVKLAQSANGSRTPIAADADGILVNLGANNDVTVTGSVAVTDNSGSLTVDDGGGSLTVDGTVAVSGTVTADTELTTADLDTGAGTDTRAVVGIVGSKSGGAALIPGDATAGLKVDLGADNDVTVTSGTITTIANVVHVDDNSGSLTVDGTVTANLAAGTNNIGDVDVLTVPAPLSTTGGGTEATALRVTVASDSTGVLSVDDNGGSLTVDGTVAVSGSVAVTDNAGSLTVDDGGSTISVDDGAGSLTVDGTVAATQSGTWTVQPGNTANTTAWLVKPAANGTASATLTDGGTTSTTFGSFDLSPYRWLVISGQSVTDDMTLQLEESTDGSTWVPVSGWNVSGNTETSFTSGSFIVASDRGYAYVFPVVAASVRVSIVSAVSGGDSVPLVLTAFASDPFGPTRGSLVFATGQLPTTLVSGNLRVSVQNTPSVSVASAVTVDPILMQLGATSALTQVSDSATSGTILASNTGRMAAIITNDSSARLYLRYEAADASTTVYTLSLAQHDSVTVEDYNGEIRGIWASDPNDGAARVTEITA